MYTKSSNMYTLQVYLYNIISNSQAVAENLASGSFMLNITSEGMVAAAVTLSIIPIVALYPFVARFMVQGITIGSVKGLSLIHILSCSKGGFPNTSPFWT